MNSPSDTLKTAPLDVTIRHEPFMPWLELHWDGQSEELEHAEALTWLSARGARDLKAANDALCHALNFGSSVFTIHHPTDQAVSHQSDQPKI